MLTAGNAISRQPQVATGERLAGVSPAGRVKSTVIGTQLSNHTNLTAWLAGAGLLVRDLLGRVTASVIGASANAEVTITCALAAAGVPPDAKVGAVRCNVYEEGFFKIPEMEGFEV